MVITDAEIVRVSAGFWMYWILRTYELSAKSCPPGCTHKSRNRWPVNQGQRRPLVTGTKMRRFVLTKMRDATPHTKLENKRTTKTRMKRT